MEVPQSVPEYTPPEYICACNEGGTQQEAVRKLHMSLEYHTF